MSSIFSPELSVGASTSIMGILGCMVGFMIMHWSSLPKQQRTMILCFIVFDIMFNFLIGITSNNIDNNGHIGGLVTGVCLGFCILSPKDEQKNPNRKMKFEQKYAAFFLIGLFILGFTVFFWPQGSNILVNWWKILGIKFNLQYIKIHFFRLVCRLDLGKVAS